MTKKIPVKKSQLHDRQCDLDNVVQRLAVACRLGGDGKAIHGIDEKARKLYHRAVVGDLSSLLRARQKPAKRSFQFSRVGRADLEHGVIARGKLGGRVGQQTALAVVLHEMGDGSGEELAQHFAHRSFTLERAADRNTLQLTIPRERRLKQLILAAERVIEALTIDAKMI